ncbi:MULTISPECIES: acyl-CoA dehydrogenase family protein [unclassified Streptomyces]|uniref:acyl-CoA dehydrogenase family protein n=1 Tax=unclassified Streptomyces TaxID=2593676 RepID=UPI000DB946DF|nr:MULTISPECIES: acyl-CoA dehydrogenase family protein [unclassified Streptomyces]MYT75450.1 acyl-CoA dehydrogenase [Streptomyces sp. SID8367]RAJ86853.1 acyl-CoA dehydrogenase [Streptomyces sp. PsTaAH-137]
MTPFLLPPMYDEFRAAARTFAEKELAPRAAETDERAEFPHDNYRRLVAAGLHAPGVPEEFGGDGTDAIAAAIAVEEVARACASSSTIQTSNKLGVTPLLLAGTPEQRGRYLPEVASGEALMAYAISEREAGSDVGAMRCRAAADGDGWVLDGVKTWITSAGVAKYLIVFAVTDPEAGSRGISAFVVHADDAGISYGEPGRKMGLKGSVTREVYFDGCRIPGDRLLGERGKGLRLALGTLDHTRVSVGAQALGIAQGALDLATGYVRERRQFGQAIADFQGVRFMLADMAMKVESARQMVYAAAARSSVNADDLTYFGAAAKCLASDTAMSVTTDAVQLLGGYGYTRDFPAERMMRDAKITQIYEGTNQIQRIVVSRKLLR